MLLIDDEIDTAIIEAQQELMVTFGNQGAVGAGPKSLHNRFERQCASHIKTRVLAKQHSSRDSLGLDRANHLCCPSGQVGVFDPQATRHVR